jgi:hypothetical protein
MDVTVGKKLGDNLTLAYISGFLDGDGAICANIEKHPGKKYGLRVRVSLDFYQHKDNLSLLKYIRNYFGEGYLGKSIRDTCKLSIRNQSSLKLILPLIHEHTHIKKKQIEIALKILNMSMGQKKDLVKMAKLADKLSRLNIRSKNRRKNFSSIIT